MRKRLTALVLCGLMLLLTIPAKAAPKIVMDLTAQPGRVEYTFLVPQEEFVILKFSTPMESGQQVIFGKNGSFSGAVLLPCTKEGGRVKVQLESLGGRSLGEGRVELPSEDGYVPCEGKSHGKVSHFVLKETTTGFSYDFYAPETDFVQLYYRSKQETGTVFILPEDTEGHYCGQIDMPLTYARTLITVKVQSAKGTVLSENTVRKGYLAPPAPERGEGRLSGVIVCIDPGHQENGRIVTEPKGPGLSGSVTGAGGSAQGKATLRREAIVTLEISILLRDVLLQQGAEVVMTRKTQDIFHTNIERAEIAKAGNADIMLRLHCDMVENAGKRGMSVHAPLNSTYARNVAEPALYRQMGEIMLDAMRRSAGYEIASKTGYVGLGDGFVGNNWAEMTCFLIEMGYMSNVQDDYLLSQPVHQQRVAEGIAQGVYDIAVLRGWVGAE